jgi:hypothetical protein
VNRVSSAQKKPNNAWVFFSVERVAGEPVTDLTADDFSVYEDGHLVSKDDNRQLLQSPDVAAVMYTLLLVDLSGTSTAGPPDEIVGAAKAFAERLGKGQRVGVYGFDGEAKIHPILPLSGDAAASASAFDTLRRFRTKDPSTNLHGAVVEGLQELRRALERERKPLRFGTLVVLAQGIDRANRVSRDAMRNEWDDDKYKLYEVLSVGAGQDRSFLDEVGRDAVEAAPDPSGLKDALDRVAGRIEAHAKRYYLLSFCTTARNGEREVRIQARTKNPDASGSFTYTFNADGLGPPPDCDAKTPPAFDLKLADEKPKEKPDAKPEGKRPAGSGDRPAGSSKPGTKPVLLDTPVPDAKAP